MNRKKKYSVLYGNEWERGEKNFQVVKTNKMEI